MEQLLGDNEQTSNTRTTTTMSGDVQHPKYLDKEYIVRAREAEVKHHLHSINELQKKMERLASELAWELEQHHSKIHELYQLEMPFKKQQETGSTRIKVNKKSAAKPRVRRTLDTPLIGEPICESVA